jgi:hypothetical protein
MDQLVVLWGLFAIVVAVAAGARGRNPLGWFLLACVISPLLAVILLALMPSGPSISKYSWLEWYEGKVRKCPFCAAGSTGRCNTGVKSLCCWREAK